MFAILALCFVTCRHLVKLLLAVKLGLTPVPICKLLKVSYCTSFSSSVLQLLCLAVHVLACDYPFLSQREFRLFAAIRRPQHGALEVLLHQHWLMPFENKRPGTVGPRLPFFEFMRITVRAGFPPKKKSWKTIMPFVSCTYFLTNNGVKMYADLPNIQT